MIIFTLTLFFVWIFFFIFLVTHEEPYSDRAKILEQAGKTYSLYCTCIFLFVWTMYGMCCYEGNFKQAREEAEATSIK